MRRLLEGGAYIEILISGAAPIGGNTVGLMRNYLMRILPFFAKLNSAKLEKIGRSH